MTYNPYIRKMIATIIYFISANMRAMTDDNNLS